MPFLVGGCVAHCLTDRDAESFLYRGLLLAFCVLFLFALVPQSRAEIRPERFIDGEALANYLTIRILNNTDRDVRLRQDWLPTMNYHLWLGRPFLGEIPSNLPNPEFRGMDYPNRLALKKWMLSRPDNSISPDQFFGKAIELENGNVQRGLMLAWDTLGEGHIFAKERNNYPHTKKLIDITGERDVFTGNYYSIERRRKDGTTVNKPVESIRGDNFSAWYHFAGVALRSFTTANSGFSLLSGKTYANVLIFLEEYAIHNIFIDPEKRRLIDYQGAIFGSKLAKNLRRHQDSDSFRASGDSINTHYLYNDFSRISDSWPLRTDEKPLDYYYRNPHRKCLKNLKLIAGATAVAGAITSIPYVIRAVLSPPKEAATGK